jgi:hypothetical protein
MSKWVISLLVIDFLSVAKIALSAFQLTKQLHQLFVLSPIFLVGVIKLKLQTQVAFESQMICISYCIFLGYYENKATNNSGFIM